MSFRAFLPALLLAGGCASHPAAINGPGRATGASYGWPPGSGHAASDNSELANSRAPDGSLKRSPVGVKRTTIREPQTDYAAPLPYNSTTQTPEPTNAPLMGESACLSELTERGVRFKRVPSVKGIEVPIDVESPLGGVTFWAADRRPVRMDCRLALALERLEPVFKKHGVTRARFSGAYVYKQKPSGRLSQHAYGLAIDIHEFTAGTETLDVQKSFARNTPCSDVERHALNALSCELRESAAFQEFLTPDYNYDHRDHLHISVPKRSSSVKR